jgi:hypothetical protein
MEKTPDGGLVLEGTEEVSLGRLALVLSGQWETRLGRRLEGAATAIRLNQEGIDTSDLIKNDVPIERKETLHRRLGTDETRTMVPPNEVNQFGDCIVSFLAISENNPEFVLDVCGELYGDPTPFNRSLVAIACQGMYEKATTIFERLFPEEY